MFRMTLLSHQNPEVPRQMSLPILQASIQCHQRNAATQTAMPLPLELRSGKELPRQQLITLPPCKPSDLNSLLFPLYFPLDTTIQTMNNEESRFRRQLRSLKPTSHLECLKYRGRKYY